MTASVSPTATSTASLGAGGGGGTPGVTPTSGPSSTGGGGGTRPGGFPLGTVLFVLVGLALSLGAGWLLFHHVLMPANEVKLKPSGARPWSRTRVP
ncbi:MAG: hypothetical protein ACRDHW_11355, partial [Ktedonobacteraceae bacterium]